MNTTADTATRKHVAIPDRDNRTYGMNANGKTTSTCRWCGQEIFQAVAHMGQNNSWRHYPKAAK